MKNCFTLCILLSFLWACAQKPNISQKNDTTIIKRVEQVMKTLHTFSDAGRTDQLYKDNQLDAHDVFKLCNQYELDFNVITRMVRGVYFQPNANYEKKYPETEWYLSRLPLAEFAQVLYYHKESYHKSFLDVGSGNGDKVYTALCMGFEKGYGVEYEKKLNDVALEALQPMIEKKLADIKLGDATKLSDDYFAKMDFIYMYCPLILNQPEQAKLMLRILKNMRDNSFVYEAGFVYAQDLKKLGIQMDVDDGYRGYLSVKKEKGKYYYKIFIKEWKEMGLK